MACRGCGDRTVTGCLCDIAASDSFSVAGAGSEASKYTISPDLDVSATNLLSCSASGLLGALPTLIASPPACAVYRTSNQSIPNNTWTALAFNAELYDTDTMHTSGANTRITFTTAGVYLVTLYVLWNKSAASATAFYLAKIEKNNTDQIAYEVKRLATGSTDLFVGHSITILESFAATDFIEAEVRQTTGAALHVVADVGSPLFTAKRMSDA